MSLSGFSRTTRGKQIPLPYVTRSIPQSFVNPGDEVILISPAFDIYIAQVCVYVCVCPGITRRAIMRGARNASPLTEGANGWRNAAVRSPAARSRRCRRNKARFVQQLWVSHSYHLLLVARQTLHANHLMQRCHIAVWRLDMAELRSSFSERTAAIVINTPQVRPSNYACPLRDIIVQEMPIHACCPC